MKCENLRRALYAYPHPEPNSLRPRKKEKICAFRFASFVPNERPGGGGARRSYCEGRVCRVVEGRSPTSPQGR